jgi:predicted metal-dependent hydrolase
VNIRDQSIEVRGIPVEIVRKDIKNLHLGVYPPNGRVRVAAPLRLNDEAVRLAVVTRLGWIRRQQVKFEKQERQSPREMVSGEAHYFRGRRYRLDVIETDGAASVRLRTNNKLELRVRPGSTRSGRETVLVKWYRDALERQVADLVAKWEPRIGVSVTDWAVRKMKTRWGTCNKEAGRIWINLELAKKPPSCVELIVVHEMLHLRHRHHDDAFSREMSRHLSHWRSLRDELNSAPLGHDDWAY